MSVNLAGLLREKAMIRNKLSRLTGVKYEVADRCCKAQNIELVDLDFPAKVCCVPGCRIGDLLEYCPPEGGRIQ